MTSNNFLIESQALHFGEIESAIRALLLDGIDVRVTPISRDRALLPSHLIDAINYQYGIDAWKYLRFKGISFTSATRITDEDALALVAHRASSEMDSRSGFAGLAAATETDWHLKAINAPTTWNILGGVENIQWRCKVGQIDTGYMRHPALGFNTTAGTWIDQLHSTNFFSPDANTNRDVGPSNGEDSQSGPFWGHGTRIGATISGYAPAASGGAFYDGAPRVPHTMVRISDTVLINDQQVALASAIRHLVDVAQVDVINLSMGLVPRLLTKSVKAALNNAYESGVIFICAGGQYVQSVVAPACASRTIAVGGITIREQIWANSSRGAEIDWSAPAADMRRATRNTPNGTFVYGNQGDGTSYATALTTAAAALWLTHNFDGIMQSYQRTWQRVAAFKKIGRQFARKPKVTWGDDIAGKGILDMSAILQAPLPPIASLDKEPSL
jgi:hypothetical protein